MNWESEEWPTSSATSVTEVSRLFKRRFAFSIRQKSTICFGEKESSSKQIRLRLLRERPECFAISSTDKGSLKFASI